MRIGVDVVKFSDKCTKGDAANKNTEKNASVDTFMQDSCLNAKPCHPHPDISSHLFQYQLIHVHTRLQWHRLRQAKHQQIKSVQCKEQFPWYPNALLNLTWSFFLPLKVIIKKILFCPAQTLLCQYVNTDSQTVWKRENMIYAVFCYQ